MDNTVGTGSWGKVFADKWTTGLLEINFMSIHRSSGQDWKIIGLIVIIECLGLKVEDTKRFRINQILFTYNDS